MPTSGVLGLDVVDHDRHLGQAERLGGRDAVKAGDELEAVAVLADDDRDEHALQLDRPRERLHVRVVERADVVGDADPVERDLAPDLGSHGGHVALLGTPGPARAGGVRQD
jgi:hypothetical protein